jgi:hypothetical protein
MNPSNISVIPEIVNSIKAGKNCLLTIVTTIKGIKTNLDIVNILGICFAKFFIFASINQ